MPLRIRGRWPATYAQTYFSIAGYFQSRDQSWVMRRVSYPERRQTRTSCRSASRRASFERHICSSRAQRHFTIPRSSVQSRDKQFTKGGTRWRPQGTSDLWAHSNSDFLGRRSRVPSGFSSTTMSSHSALFVPFDVGENSTPFRYTSQSCFSTQVWQSVAEIQTWSSTYRSRAVQAGTCPGNWASSSSMVVRRNSASPRSTLQRAPTAEATDWHPLSLHPDRIAERSKWLGQAEMEQCNYTSYRPAFPVLTRDMPFRAKIGASSFRFTQHNGVDPSLFRVLTEVLKCLHDIRPTHLFIELCRIRSVHSWGMEHLPTETTM